MTQSRKKKVLYIDDNPSRVELLQLILKKERKSIEYHSVTSVLEGIDLAQKLKPDLILVCEWLDSEQVDKLYLSKETVLNNTPIIGMGSRWDNYKYDLPMITGNRPRADIYYGIPYLVDELLQGIDQFLK